MIIRHRTHSNQRYTGLAGPADSYGVQFALCVCVISCGQLDLILHDGGSAQRCLRRPAAEVRANASTQRG